MKRLIGLIFYRNMLVDSLHWTDKNGLAEVIFHSVILSKITQKVICTTTFDLG